MLTSLHTVNFKVFILTISTYLSLYFSHWMKNQRLCRLFVTVRNALRDIHPIAFPLKLNQLVAYHACKARFQHTLRAGEKHAGLVHVVVTTSLSHRHVIVRQMWYARNAANVLLELK